MLTRTIKYTDYNGEEHEENFLFSLNKAELLRMNMSKRGGMSEYLERLVKESDPEKLTAMFEDLILSSYGEKSEDGKRFEKSKEISDNFKNSAAYAQLFYELATDTGEFTKFFLGTLPPDVRSQINEADMKAIATK